MSVSSKWVKAVWIGILFLFFVLFSSWYGGKGKPISSPEGAALLAEMRAVYGVTSTSEGNFIANVEAMIPNDDGREFYAVNLEQLKSGGAAEEADRAYAAIVFPLLFKRASHPVFVSYRAGLMLGDYGDEVDRVAVVRYRSLRDMIEMTLEPNMRDGSDLKFAALDHTEVFITRPVITFMHVRLVVALVLLLVGWLGLRAINWLSRRMDRASGSETA